MSMTRITAEEWRDVCESLWHEYMTLVEDDMHELDAMAEVKRDFRLDILQGKYREYYGWSDIGENYGIRNVVEMVHYGGILS